MAHQLEPNTYTIFDSENDCKKAFFLAERNGIQTCSTHVKGETAMYFDKRDMDLNTMPIDNIENAPHLRFVPTQEFVDRINGNFK